jgi:hypothetical protein
VLRRSAASHLLSLTSQVNSLTLSNQWLHTKSCVLEWFVGCAEQYAAMVEAVNQELDKYKSNTSLPATGAAAFRNMSATKFITTYRQSITWASKWVLQGSMAAADAHDMEGIRDALAESLRLFHYANSVQPGLVSRAHEEMKKELPQGFDEVRLQCWRVPPLWRSGNVPYWGRFHNYYHEM